MTNNAQLLPLPELSDDDLELLHYNPNTSDVVEFLHRYAQSYALACIEAAKPADALFTTGHCAENAKPGECQRHNLQCGYPDCDRRPAEPTCKQTLQVDALGSLPVVAEVSGNGGWHIKPIAPELHIGMKLADHAQATAEIAKRDAEIERLHALSKEYFDKMNEWRDAYEAAQAENSQAK